MLCLLLFQQALLLSAAIRQLAAVLAQTGMHTAFACTMTPVTETPLGQCQANTGSHAIHC
jgi:hypothetical protein